MLVKCNLKNQVPCNLTTHLNDFEILPEPSYFMAYAFVRQHVLRNHLASYTKAITLSNDERESEAGTSKQNNLNLIDEQRKTCVPQVMKTCTSTNRL